jgi:hypothetical protein
VLASSSARTTAVAQPPPGENSTSISPANAEAIASQNTSAKRHHFNRGRKI